MPVRGEAEIPMANFGGIMNWKAEGTGAILIQSRHDRYYRATFMSPCYDLPYAEDIRFATGAIDTLDRFDSVIVRGHQCFFRTFEEIPKPEKF